MRRRRASSKCARRASTFWLLVRAASLQEGWPLVFGSKSVEEGGDTHQSKGGRTSGAWQHGDMGGGATPAESDIERLDVVLQLWNSGRGVPGGSQLRL